MALKVLKDIVSNPLGTARLLEAYSTLERAKQANLTDEQIRMVFPDARKYSPSQLEGFLVIGEDLVAGRTRFNGRLISDEQSDGLSRTTGKV